MDLPNFFAYIVSEKKGKSFDMKLVPRCKKKKSIKSERHAKSGEIFSILWKYEAL